LTNSTAIERRLAAIFAADVEGYSRLMGADEVGTLERLTERRAILDKAIAGHRGRIANTAGDSVLAEFGSAVDAVNCAVAAQAALAEANASLPSDKRINFRIGIHVGDVMVRSGDLFGDGVNIAARLQTLAHAGGVCVSGVTYDQVRKVLSIAFTDLGAQQVKNIEEPVRVYAVSGLGETGIGSSTEDIARVGFLLDKPSIAVLPFQNMSGDPEQEYFADGMVEDIITALSRFKSLFVIARNSSFTYKGKTIDIKQVGGELGVRYVLEGSIRKAGGRVRITAQLIEAATNAHLSADRFEGALDDIFELQDKVTASVVGLVEPSIQQIEIQRALQKPTSNLEAHDCYLRALPKYNQRTRDANQQAHQLLSRAVELDPNYAAAYMQLSFCHAQRWMQTWTDDRAREVSDGDRFKERALELGKNDPVVLAGVAYLHIQFGGDAATAVSLIDRAIALNPNLSAALETSTWVRVRIGDPEIAIEHCHRALQLNPLTQTKTPLAVAYFLLGRKEEALACVEEALINAPRALPALRFAATIKGGFGLLEETRQLIRRIFEINPNARLGPEGSGWAPLKPEYRQKWVEARRVLFQLGYPE
jgi:TolB-like protein/class 3 adenylate cyclase